MASVKSKPKNNKGFPYDQYPLKNNVRAKPLKVTSCLTYLHGLHYSKVWDFSMLWFYNFLLNYCEYPNEAIQLYKSLLIWYVTFAGTIMDCFTCGLSIACKPLALSGLKA